MGDAPEWQTEVVKALTDLDIVILNPRRKDWNPNISQTIDNATFNEQVEWELCAQERATIIAFNFVQNTPSPITLFEFGMAVKNKRTIVFCQQGFWRKGNIDAICKKYGITQANSIRELTLMICKETKCLVENSGRTTIEAG